MQLFRRYPTQATRQAAWRLQVRTTSNTMLVLVGVLVVSALYLAVNARLARAGRELLDLQAHRAELARQAGDLTGRLADLTTPKRMLERASSLGFQPAHAKDIEYLVVDGYSPPPGFVAPRPIGSPPQPRGGLSPAYTETLGEWLQRMLSGIRGAS
ncbi:MAG TPA: hypothetical protein VFI11_04990 [Anaerolineales bacterium]|nr:hypothetical protein [Anaerolineales bacterium]